MRAISGKFLSFVVVALLVPGLASAAVERRKFTTPNGYLIVEVLDGLMIANSDEGNAEVEAAVRAKVEALTARFPIYPGAGA